MDLSLYDVIKRTRISQKTYRLNRDLQQLVLDVHPAANKNMIKQALQNLFDIQVDSVRVALIKGKRKRSGRHVYQEGVHKKAYISLKPGQEEKLNSISQASVQDAGDVQGGA